jgi:hypothetical protein
MVTRTMKTGAVESLSPGAVLRGPADDHRASSDKRRVPPRRVDVVMRIVACGLITGAALLAAVPVAIADAPVSTTSSDNRAAPQAEVSMLAVSLTVGGAVAAAGSGMALVLTRRRAISSVTGSPVQDHVTSD